MLNENTNIPNEAYSFQYSVDELHTIYNTTIKYTYKKPIRTLVILTIVFVFCVITAIFGDTDTEIIAFFLGALLVLFVSVFGLRNANEKALQASVPKVTSGRYDFKIYDNYIILDIYRNQELKNKLKIYFAEIQSIVELDNFFIFQYNNQSYILKKADMDINSRFYAFLNHHPTKKILKQSKKNSNPDFSKYNLNPYINNTNPKNTVGTNNSANTNNTVGTSNFANTNNTVSQPIKTESERFTVISVILFIGCFVALFLPPQLLQWIAGVKDYLPVSQFWIFFCFLPIPIALIILGLLSKTPRQKRRNIITGIIFTVLLTIFGSFSFIFSASHNNDKERIANIENYTGIDIPVYQQVDTYFFQDYTQSDSENHPCAKSAVFFAQKDVEEFEKDIAYNENWLTVIPNDMQGILNYMQKYSSYEYALIYNVDTKEINTIPSENGTYEFVSFFYDTHQNTMEIVQYDIVYVTTE